MRQFRLRLILILVLAPLAAAAIADQAAEQRLTPAWQALDADKDGAVALEELHPLQARVMSLHDADGDGMISLTEYVSYDLDPGGASRIPIPPAVRLVEDVPYAASDDPRQRLDIYLPDQPADSKPLPVIAYLHGGGWLLGSKVAARTQALPLVASGRFAAVSIGYRLSWQETWPAQVHDVKAGIRWIRAHAKEYGMDPARICAFGPSAGGHLAAILGTTNGVQNVEGALGENTDQSSDVQCVIDFFGPADLRDADALDPLGNPSTVTKLLGRPAEEAPALAANASPLVHVDAGDVPFLIVHGTDDTLVPYSESVELATALRKVGVPVILQTVQGGGHGTFGSATTEINGRVSAFLEKTFYDKEVLVPGDTLAAEP
jgi:acetyl esterase/lipase